MKLFYVPGVCSLSPHIALYESGLPFTADRVDRATKISKGGVDYKALNPKGYVPALQLDDGQLLTEGTAIVQYIADQVPAKKLAPANGTLERYRLQEWLNYIATEIHKGTSPLFNPKFPEDLRKAAKDRLVDRYAYVNKQLAGKTFLMGDTFTVADCYLYTIWTWLPRVNVELTDMPNLTSYMQRLGERPAFKAALEAEKAA